VAYVLGEVLCAAISASCCMTVCEVPGKAGHLKRSPVGVAADFEGAGQVNRVESSNANASSEK